MQMLNVVEFKFSDLYTLVGNSCADKLKKTFNDFTDTAAYYCVEIRSIRLKNVTSDKPEREDKYGPLGLVRNYGKNGGIFIIVDESLKEVLRIGFSDDFSKKDLGVMRYITCNNGPMEKHFAAIFSENPNLCFETYINQYSIFFLFLNTKTGTKKSKALKNLVESLNKVLRPTMQDDKKP